MDATDGEAVRSGQAAQELGKEFDVVLVEGEGCVGVVGRGVEGSVRAVDLELDRWLVFLIDDGGISLLDCKYFVEDGVVEFRGEGMDLCGELVAVDVVVLLEDVDLVAHVEPGERRAHVEEGERRAHDV